jgi:lysophospholipase L1-like esterase
MSHHPRSAAGPFPSTPDDTPATAAVLRGSRPRWRTSAAPRRTLAAVAVGVLLLAGPAASAHAAVPTAASDSSAAASGDSWLPLSVAGSPYTELTKAGMPGGGWLIGLHERPGEDGAAKSATVTLTAGVEALATAAAANKDGQMVPTKSRDIEGLTTKTAHGKTVITLTSTPEDQTFFILPVKAPEAADPDDQNALDRAWNAVVDFLTSDEEEEGDSSQDAAGGEDASDGSESTASPSSATSGETSTAPAPAEGDSDSGDAGSSGEQTPTAEPTTSPSSDSSDEAPSGEPSDGSDQDAGDAGPCVITDSQTQDAQTEDSDTGQQLEAGPNAAPTFSEETRRQALAAAGCNPDGTPTSGEDTDAGDSSDDTGTSGSSSSSAKLGLAQGDWYSGASGETDRRKALEQARGADMEIATTWQHGSSSSISLDVLKSGGEYSKENWQGKALILSVSPFPDGDGSWEAAASGDYTAKWAEQARNAKAGWGEDRGAPLIASVAWELNGNWFKWSAKKEQTESVKKALRLWSDTWAKEFPDAFRIVTFNFNSNGYDGNSTDLWPGGSMQGIGEDGYNHYPHVSTAEEFKANYLSRDGGGGPQGPGAWLAAAKEARVPLFLPEWNNNPSQGGESVAYMEGMHKMFSENAGPGAGQVAGEVVFITDIDGGNWNLGSGSKMPKTAAAYDELFSDVGSGSSTRPASSDDEASGEETRSTEEPSDASSDGSDGSGDSAPTATATATATARPARATSTSTGPVSIMAVGDSIIDNGSGGVRTPLQKMLTDDGVKADWVGPNSGGPADLADKDHAAKSGVLVKELKDDVGAWAAQYKPDVVYIDAGRNDEMWGNSDGVAGDYASMLDTICEQDPGVSIIAALNHAMGPGARDNGAETVLTELNPAITKAAASARGAGCDVQAVDLSKVITSDLRADDVHPSTEGYQAEAEVIYPVLSKVLSSLNA